MPNLSDLFSAGGFLKWDGAGNADADYSSNTAAELAADAAFTGAFAPLQDEIYLSVAEFESANGGTAQNVVGSASTKRTRVWNFTQNSGQSIVSTLRIPDHWTSGVDIYAVWTNASVDVTGVACWQANWSNFTDGGSIDAETAGAAGLYTPPGQYVLSVDLIESAASMDPNRVNRLEIIRPVTASDTWAQTAPLVGIILRGAAIPSGWLQ